MNDFILFRMKKRKHLPLFDNEEKSLVCIAEEKMEWMGNIKKEKNITEGERRKNVDFLAPPFNFSTLTTDTELEKPKK